MSQELSNVTDARLDAPPRIWELAFPTIVGNLMVSVVAIMQTKFVGVLGPNAVAAVGAGQRVFFAAQAMLMAISVGTTALIARAWGARERHEASHVLTASLLLAGVTGAFIALLGIVFARDIVDLTGLDPATSAAAALNIKWLSAFMVGFAINIVVSAALRAAGDTWTPLVFVTAVNFLNVPLLYVFIFGYGGMPRMEAAGAAFASGLSFTVGGLVLVWLWLRQKLSIVFDTRQWRDGARYRQLIHIGYPALIEQLMLQSGLFVFLALIGNYYGTEAFAAYGVAINLLNVGMVVGFGFSIAGSTLVGQHLGAGDVAAARRSGWRAMGLAVLSMSAIGLVTALNAEPLARFFLGNAEVTVRHTVEVTNILALSFPLLAIEFSLGGALRGAGDTRFPLLNTFAGLVIVRCGLALFFIHLRLPVVWIYGCMIGEYCLRGVLLVWRFSSNRWENLLSNRAAGMAAATDAV